MKSYQPPTTATLRIFKPGSDVLYKGWAYTIDHVIIRGHDIFLQLQNCPDNLVNSELVEIEPVTISLNRSPEKKL